MNRFKSFFTGTIIAFSITFFILIVFSALLVNTNISESSIDIVVFSAAGVSLFIEAVIINLKENKNGILNGACLGITYVITLYFISSILSNNYVVNTHTVICGLIGILISIIGSILGVNINVKNNKK